MTVLVGEEETVKNTKTSEVKAERYYIACRRLGSV
jgi:hypothetical protein